MEQFSLMDFEFEEGEYEQQTAAPMTAHDLASEDALLRLEQRMNAEVDRFLAMRPNAAALNAAVEMSIGLSQRLLARLQEMEPAVAEHDHVSSSDIDPTLQMGPYTGGALPQQLPSHSHPQPLSFRQPLFRQSLFTQASFPQPLPTNQAAPGGSTDLGFDFQSVLPDSILEIQCMQPYDALWPSKFGISQQRLADFEAAFRCKQKLEDIVRHGVIQPGDELGVLVHYQGEPSQWRYAQVASVEYVPAPPSGGSHWTPQLVMLDARGGQALSQPGYCGYNPGDIAQAIASFHSGNVGADTVGRGASSGKSSYSILFLFRADEELGSIVNVRAAFAMWQKMVDLWAERMGVKWRTRRVDKAGKVNPSACIEKREKDSGDE